MAIPRYLPPGPLDQHDEIEQAWAARLVPTAKAPTNLFGADQPWAPSTEAWSGFDMALFVFLVVGLGALVLKMGGWVVLLVAI